MVKMLIRLLIQALAVFITAWLLSGVSVNDLYSALIVAVVLGIINTFVKPILAFLTLPISVITLGLFSFVLNALLILLVDHLVDGFAVANFWWAIIFGLVLSIVNWVLTKIVE
jgi:putative membrane protein